MLAAVRTRVMGSTRRDSRALVLLACFAAIGCDRLTKYAAATKLAQGPELSMLAGTVQLSYAENTGGFLSLGADLPVRIRLLVFSALTGVMLVGLALVAIRRRWDGAALLGAALIVAGGASNWVDRIAAGSVIDFINVGVGPIRTGIFNVADVAILVGVGLLVLTGSKVWAFDVSP